ncbi:hypothetical protein [Bacillus cereus]|uniref:hypothetical protein n=1 Tax=Bacillus cereus TaxID=1396 RepID=UPI000BF63AC7|nr:hypothetical protein [Bacillus cereus]PFH89295.1 hypothetical protein COI78_24165 [Bacillus cereus]
MKVEYTSYFTDLLSQLEEIDQDKIKNILSELEQATIQNSSEFEHYIRTKGLYIARTRKLDSVKRYTYLIRIDEDIRLLIKIENDTLIIDSLIYRNSFLDNYLHGGDTQR